MINKLDKKTFGIITLLVASLGGFISLYLWNAHVNSSSIVCTTGCEAVISGDYGMMFGVPVSVYGFAYYAALIFVTFLRMNIDDLLLDRLMGIFLGFGVLFTLYLRYLEFFKIGEICIWCWGSAAVVVILVALYSWEMWGRFPELLGRK